MSAQEPADEVNTAINLSDAIEQIVAPLVRLCLAHGMKYPEIAEQLKTVFIRQASEHSKIAGRANISQISVATGLNRKDVGRVLDTPIDSSAQQPKAIETIVLTRWISDARFQDAAGEPLLLPRHSLSENDSSFESLVRELIKDVHPRAVLESMLRMALVAQTSDDKVQLLQRAFVPKGNQQQMLEFLATNVGDHSAAAARNVQGQDPPFLEQSIFGRYMTAQTTHALHEQARRLWKPFFEEFMKKAIELEASQLAAISSDDANAAPADERFRLGVYFYSEPGKTKE
jgi:Family of unknown function (DUF6502)